MKETVITRLTILSDNRVVKIVAVGEGGCVRIVHFKEDGEFKAYNDKNEKIFEAKNIASYMIDCFEKEVVYNYFADNQIG